MPAVDALTGGFYLTMPINSCEHYESTAEPGDRIVVRTPDQREFRGRLIGYRGQGDRRLAVVRLDTGWETTYPVAMVWKDQS